MERIIKRTFEQFLPIIKKRFVLTLKWFIVVNKICLIVFSFEKRQPEVFRTSPDIIHIILHVNMRPLARERGARLHLPGQVNYHSTTGL